MLAFPAWPVIWHWDGWNALVAIGTIGLAFGTVWLGWQTRDATRIASQEIKASLRPYLTVAPAENRLPLGQASETYSYDGVRIDLGVRNDGAGPALVLGVETDAPDLPVDQVIQASHAVFPTRDYAHVVLIWPLARSPQPADSGVTEGEWISDESKRLTQQAKEMVDRLRANSVTVRVSYSDLNGGQVSTTEFQLESPSANSSWWRVSKVTVTLADGSLPPSIWNVP